MRCGLRAHAADLIRLWRLAALTGTRCPPARGLVANLWRRHAALVGEWRSSIGQEGEKAARRPLILYGVYGVHTHLEFHNCLLLGHCASVTN